MAFCINCGLELSEEAKFCSRCGKAIESNNSSNQRETVYDGVIHKCPHCGETLNAFESICPACGAELRGAKSSDAISTLAEKLEKATSEKQRIVIIKNFPIPNTREDILEFMLLASSNFDSSYYVTHLHEEDVSDAWLAKIEQCYSKAKLSFGSHPDFERIECIYRGIKDECADKERKVKCEEKARKEAQERAESAKGFKKSKLRIVIIIFAVISAICIAVSFNDEKVLSGIIAIIMFVSFIATFLMGFGVIREKVRNFRLIPLILALVLFVPYFAAYSSDVKPVTFGDDSANWDEIMLNAYAPNPNMTSANVMQNTKEEFYIYDIKCSQTEYYDYVDRCKEFGYDYEIIREEEYYFEACNEAGYKINVSYLSNLDVQLNAPMKMSSLEWPRNGMSKLIPKPKATKGIIKIDTHLQFVVYVGETTRADYDEYVNACIDKGFTVDYSKSNNVYSADNKKGDSLRVEYEGNNTMFISMYAGD